MAIEGETYEYSEMYPGFRKTAVEEGNAAETKVATLKDDGKVKDAMLTAALAAELKNHGYPTKADPAKLDKVMVTIILIYLVILVTMVYGPIAAMLVEMFPTRIRYTSMSLPYHIGNGVFGGLLPLIGLSIVAHTGNIFAGLYYPIAVAALTFVVGSLLLVETHQHKIWDEVDGPRP